MDVLLFPFSVPKHDGRMEKNIYVEYTTCRRKKVGKIYFAG